MTTPGEQTTMAMDLTDLVPAPGAAPVTTGAVLRRVGRSLLVACVVPAAIFYSCFEAFGVTAAMLAALAWAYGATTWRAVTGRAVSGMLLVTATVLTVRTAVALLAHSDFVYFVQPALSDASLGLAFLGSLLIGRPLVARMAGDFYPVSADVVGRPALIALFRRLTGFWAAVLVGKATLVVVLLTHLSETAFVRTTSAANPLLNLAAAAATIAMANWVLRREGLIGAAPTDRHLLEDLSDLVEPLAPTLTPALSSALTPALAPAAS